MRLLLCVFLLIGFFASAQDSTRREKSASSFDVLVGQKILLNEALNRSVGDFQNARFGQPMMYIGIGMTSVLMINRKYSFPAQLAFSHLVPQPIELNDSISGRISGFNISVPLAGYDPFRYSKTVDVLFETGFNTGRVRLFGDARLEQVNAYFAPFVSFSPRIVLGKIAVRWKLMFEFDMTRSTWRNVWFSNSPKVDLGPMKSSGFSSFVSVGWAWD